MKEYFDIATHWFLTSGFRILVIAVLALIAMKLARFVSTRIFSASKKEKDPEFQKRVDTLSGIIRYIIVICIFVLAAIMIMGEFGIQIGPVLAAKSCSGCHQRFFYPVRRSNSRGRCGRDR